MAIVISIEARNLQVGDVLPRVPGWMLHEDLSGIIFQVKVEGLSQRIDEPEQIRVHHLDNDGGESITWWKLGEPVVVSRS